MLSRILSMARSSANRTLLPVLGLCCTVCDLAGGLKRNRFFVFPID